MTKRFIPSFVTRWHMALVVALAASGVAPALAAPDHALKDVMKKMNAQILNGDAKSLAPLFETTKTRAKPEFANWNAIVDRGKSAAEAGNLDGAKATCKECHDSYRNDYKTKYGSKAP
jgi:soluble cytochrome b562